MNTTKPLTRAKIRANRKKWIAALRSGKYKQTRGQLKNTAGTDPKYCCLGVAAELCGLKGCMKGESLLDHECGVMGLSARQARDLVALNDDYHKRFKTIAKAIEAMPIIYPEGVE